MEDEILEVEKYIDCKIERDELDMLYHRDYKTLIGDLDKKVSSWAENQNTGKGEVQAKKVVMFKDILGADKNLDGYKELFVKIFDNEYS
jgi:pyrimidine operon attenuation protein/uracil phosphoribosyltransferase